jgi:hypothetical protein
MKKQMHPNSFAKYCLLLSTTLLTLIAYGQRTEFKNTPIYDVTITNWGIKTIATTVETKKVLSFDNAVADDLAADIPYYSSDAEIGSVSIVLKDIKTIALTSEEKLLVKSKVSTSFKVEYYSATIKKQAYTYYKINAIRLNPQTNELERLSGFNITKNTVAATLKATSATRTYGANSVLSSGDFYKFNVVEDGMYKITYSDLRKLGIDVATVNPRNIKIYSNGGAMLPTLNSEYRPDDLTENSIYIEGEADGKLDSLDYILFYGQKPNRWKEQTSKNCKKRKLRYEQNIWTDSTAYFVTVATTYGKRVVAGAVLSNANYTFSSYYNAIAHEKDLVNVINSGKEFYGELFGNIPSYNFAVAMPNVTQDSIALVVSCASRYINPTQNGPTLYSNFTVNMNGTDLTTIAMPSIPNYGSQQYLNEIVLPTEVCKVIPDQPASSNLLLTYGKINDSYAYLNKYELHFRSNLKLDKSQTIFRNIDSVGINRTIALQATDLASTTKIWDVTNNDAIVSVPFTLVGNNTTLVVDGSKPRNFIGFDGTSYYTPSFVEKIKNQNLHAIQQADMIIVTHPKFLKYAKSIGDLHQTKDTLNTVVVTTTEIYNEFGGGNKDIVAIKDFIKMLYDRNGINTVPKYVLLFGDASFNRILSPALNTDYVPSFESDNSHHPVETYVTDDYFVTLDDNEGSAVNDKVDVSIGRFPVQTEDDAKSILNKIDHYLNKDSYYTATQTNTFVPGKTAYTMGDWRNSICLVADDEDGNAHMSDAEKLANKLTTEQPTYNIDKVYLDAYTQLRTAGGDLYPDVNEAINRRMDKGCLIMNYSGHGGEIGWTSERCLDNSMITSWKNIDNLPFFITATCEFGRYDDPGRVSSGELILLTPNGGGVGLLTTTRPVYGYANSLLNLSFYNEVFKLKKGLLPRLGDVMIPIKNGADLFRANNRKFCLLGDPALRLSYPKQLATTDSINGIKVVLTSTAIIDTVTALSKIKVKGHIVNKSTGAKLNDFNGLMYPTIYDKAINGRTIGNDVGNSIPVNFKLQKNIVYKGVASVSNGNFEFECLIPKDIIQDTGRAKLSYYFENGEIDGAGYDNHVWLNGINLNAAADDKGPEIKLYMNDYKFVNDGLTNDKPLLLAKLYDENGINTVGTGLGHDITGIIDEQSSKKIIMNDYYNSEINSYQKGVVSYPLNKLTEGTHNLRLKAFDTYNNSNEELLNFIVAGSQKVALEHVFNYPNPFTTHTSFYMEHNKPFSQLNVQLQIFTITGKVVKSFDLIAPTAGTLIGPIEWDGKDEYGDQLAKGVYIYKVKLRSANGDLVEKFEKLVILK